MYPPTPSLPTKILPAKICWLKLSGRIPVDMRIPRLVKPPEIQSLRTPGQNPLKYRMEISFKEIHAS